MGGKSTPMEEKIETLKELISSYPDFPKPGILFRYQFLNIIPVLIKVYNLFI
jgi:adenine/guanine phosphoribosyltransferase-like PRPP-binding protein